MRTVLLAIFSLTLAAVEPHIGTWSVVSIDVAEGASMEPEDLSVIYGEDGSMVVAMGEESRTGTCRVTKRDGATLTLESTLDDDVTADVFTTTDAGATLLTHGSTMHLVRTDAATLAAARAHRGTESAEVAKAAMAPAGDGPVVGTMGGAPWTMIMVKPSPFQAEGTWRIGLLAEKLEGFAPGKLPQLTVLVPQKIGRQEFSGRFNVTFYTPPGSNSVCTDGWLDVRTIADDLVECAIRAELDADNSVNGTFSFDPRTIEKKK